MARNRVIYQTESLMVGPSPATGTHFWNYAHHVQTSTQNPVTGSLIRELHRVQSANYEYNTTYVDVNQFGELAAIDRIILDAPTVSLDFTYLSANIQNEVNLGFTPSSGSWVSCISGMLAKVEDEKNYFIKTVDEGADVYNNADVSEGTVIGIGNGFITSYSAEGSVGNFPTVSVNVEALNMDFYNSVSGQNIPAVNPVDGTAITTYKFQLPVGISSATGVYGNPAYSADMSVAGASDFGISALRPGDITVSIYDAGTTTAYNDGGANISDWKLQSYTIGVDLSREPLQKLGSKYAFSKEIQFPLTATCSLTADMGDLQAGSLVTLINNNQSYDIVVNMNKAGTSNTAVQYQLRNAKLESQSFSSSIGSNKSVTMNFSTQIGGPSQNNIGLFMSGYYNPTNATSYGRSSWVNA